ncbi:LytTR family DNA-binding domain-containing protein [Cyclobacterium sp.]|uniref:LytR/AlgR family response regulator transcription factor n=1 Tax=Cyclobacterium sp. TaxID=1966343 RepID=UPI001999DEF3|nr:LytTR family DNA-binding domain-containing protein [Cyclobacterium sp.]MBD3627703.1 response regulator transcription factor [Cyclobacterium sp.]
MRQQLITLMMLLCLSHWTAAQEKKPYTQIGSPNRILSLDFKITFAGGQYITPIDLERSIMENQAVYQEERAFQVNGIAYLLKPISQEALAGSLQKLKSIQASDTQLAQVDRLLEQIRRRETTYRKRFLVSAGNTIKSITIQDLAYFYAENKAVFLVEQTGYKYVLDEPLDQLQEVLDPEQFFRVNRSFLVQVSAIRQMHAYSRSRIKLELEPACSKECISSTEKTAEFKDWLGG